MSLHRDHHAYRDVWPEELDLLATRLEDYTPASEIEAVPVRVRRRYAAQEAAAQSACRPLTHGVHVQPRSTPNHDDGPGRAMPEAA